MQDDSRSQEISELLYRAWCEEISQAKRPHPFLWRYAWERCWPTIRSMLKAPEARPVENGGLGIWYVILAACCSRPILAIPILLLGYFWSRGNETERENSQPR